MSRLLRRNALSLVAVFLVLSSGAYAVSETQVTNADLASGAVDTRALAAGAVEERNLADGAVGANKLKLDKLAKYVQTRVDGACADGQKIQAILVDGSVLCVDDSVNPGSITGITSSGGVTGEGTSGTVDLALDPEAVQRRVTGGCAANQGIDAIAQDGTVGCEATSTGTVTSVGTGSGLTGGPLTTSGTLAVDPSVVQERVDGTCGPLGAVTAVDKDGTVDCELVDVTANSGYVQLNDNPSQSTTLLSFNGLVLRATCAANGNGQVELVASGGGGTSINLQGRSNSAIVGGTFNNGNSVTLANTPTNDLGRFNATTSTGAQIDGTYLAWGIATTGGIDCVFTASALTFAP